MVKRILLKLFSSKISGARYLQLNDILRTGDLVLYKSVFSFSGKMFSNVGVVLSVAPIVIRTNSGNEMLYSVCRESKDIIIVRLEELELSGFRIANLFKRSKKPVEDILKTKGLSSFYKIGNSANEIYESAKKQGLQLL